MIVKFCDFCGTKLDDLYRHCKIIIEVPGFSKREFDGCDNCVEIVDTFVKNRLKKKV